MRINLIGLILLFVCSSAWAQEPPRKAADDVYSTKVRPLLAAHCYNCHSKDAEKPKGNLRLDTLSVDMADSASREAWALVARRVKAGEMPPKTKPRLDGKETQALLDWIGATLQAADLKRAAEGRVVLRRLNRIEYENTVRDLLGVHVELKEMLPVDSSASGFDNVADALHVSSFLMDKSLEGAEKALNVAIANLPQPPVIKKRYSLKETHHFKVSTERVYRLVDDTVVCFSSSPWNAVVLSPFYPPDAGLYRFRISASGFQSAGKPVTYRVDAGRMGMVGRSSLVSYFDAPADKPTVVEFVNHQEARTTMRITPYGLAGAQTVNKIGADVYQGQGLAVQWVEVEGPLHDTWPPESQRRIFGDQPQKLAPTYNYSKRVEVTSKDPEADAERILRGFGRRAFRRAVTDDDIKPFMKLFKARVAEKYSFEQAIRVALMGMMVSPEFLFLREKAGKLDDFALASRLSYFLWSSMPDDELLTLAEEKKLTERRRSAPRSSACSRAQRPRPSPRTSSASGSACATSISRCRATFSIPNLTTCSTRQCCARPTSSSTKS